MMKKLYKWYLAVTTRRNVWRVTYPDDKRTHLVSWSIGKGLRDCFGGKLWIDYEKGYF